MHNYINVLFLLDLSAAFDTIDHDILFQRLEKTFGVTGNALLWFKSYLTNRTQAVMVDGVKSNNHILKFGVPQGSVLGPVLFTIYMQPLSKIIRNYDLKYHFYADDTQLYDAVPVENVHILISKLVSCFYDIKKWMNSNKLKLNNEKTEIIACGRPGIIDNLNINEITLGNDVISLSNVVRNLGVYFDCNLSLSNHVNHIIKCMYIEIRKITKIRQFLSPKTTELLINSLVLTRLDYCNSLLCNTSQANIKSLQVVQNNAARLILRKRKFDSATPLLKTLHWLPVEKRLIYKICTIVFKSLNTEEPGYLRQHLSVYTPSRNLRSVHDPNKLIIPRIPRKIGERSFSFSAPYFWNSLPRSIRCSVSLDIFKKRLKYFLFTS